jgi:hypothetical protein
MIIKGSSRASGGALAAHLLRTDTNERVRVLEIRGTIAGDVAGAFEEMEAVASGTRCRKPLYHASIAPDTRYSMTAEQWQEAVTALERRLGLANQPRAVVLHVKDGREHCHVVWSRIDAERMKAIPDSHNYRRHEETARDLERRFGHERVQGAHAERKGRMRPKRTPSRADIQQQEREGKSGRAAVGAVRQVTAEITALWHQTNSGREFADALKARGYVLARGDRRDFVVLDKGGAVHSLARRIEGVKAAAVRERMADVDRESLPSVAEAKAALSRRSPHTEGNQAPRHTAQEPRRAATVPRGAISRAAGRATLWRRLARLVTVRARIGGFTDRGDRAENQKPPVTGRTAGEAGGHSAAGWDGVWSGEARPPPVRPALRPAARMTTTAPRQERQGERQPFRPHRHGKGFFCNGCKEWHPPDMMHCELV